MSSIANGLIFHQNKLKLLTSNNLTKIQKQHQRCSMKKGVLRNFAKFTRKQLCQNLFFNKVAGLRQNF